MISEQLEFLKNAIRNAREEVHEEVEAFLEGADKNTSGLVIKKILDDLLHSADHFEVLEIGNESSIEEVPKSHHKFAIGEKAILTGTPYVTDYKLNDVFNLNDEEIALFDFWRDQRYKHGEIGIIEAQADEVYSGQGSAYIIRIDKRKFLVADIDLGKIE